MPYDKDVLNRIYDRTDGRCHICGKKLSFSNYGTLGRKGAWEVEHSIPQSKGGTSHGNNLFPACISCNRGKQAYTSRTARNWQGRTRAPMSRRAKEENTLAGLILGGVVGSLGGPWGAIVGAGIGAELGYEEGN